MTFRPCVYWFPELRQSYPWPGDNSRRVSQNGPNEQRKSFAMCNRNSKPKLRIIFFTVCTSSFQLSRQEESSKGSTSQLLSTHIPDLSSRALCGFRINTEGLALAFYLVSETEECKHKSTKLAIQMFSSTIKNLKL